MTKKRGTVTPMSTLLVGTDHMLVDKEEDRAKLDAIAKVDEELDDQMDVIGAHLDGMLLLAQEIGSEANTQGRDLRQAHRKLVDADTRQQEAIQTTRRLIAGGRRNKPTSS